MDARVIIDRFGHHPADTQEKRYRHSTVRSIYIEMALLLSGFLPDGPDKEEALKLLEDSQRAANMALALSHGIADIDELDDRALVTLYRMIYKERTPDAASSLPRGTLLSEIKRHLAPPPTIEPVHRTQEHITYSA